jgi:DNA-binding transcriptional MocR family regulator
VKLDHALLNSPAYHSLDPVARSLYVELKRLYSGHNNGEIALGVRAAAAALNISKNTAQLAFEKLQDRGFLRLAMPSTFHQKRLSREWLLTEYADDRGSSEKPSRDFMAWVDPASDRLSDSRRTPSA